MVQVNPQNGFCFISIHIRHFMLVWWSPAVSVIYNVRLMAIFSALYRWQRWLTSGCMILKIFSLDSITQLILLNCNLSLSTVSFVLNLSCLLTSCSFTSPALSKPLSVTNLSVCTIHHTYTGSICFSLTHQQNILKCGISVFHFSTNESIVKIYYCTTTNIHLYSTLFHTKE